MSTHKREKEKIKKIIEQRVFLRPIATTSERIFSETGRILEARRQLMIPESLIFYVILDFIYETIDFIFFHMEQEK